MKIFDEMTVAAASENLVQQGPWLKGEPMADGVLIV